MVEIIILVLLACAVCFISVNWLYDLYIYCRYNRDPKHLLGRMLDSKRRKEEAKKKAMLELLQDCPMIELPDVSAAPFAQRVEDWIIKVNSGMYKSWRPAATDDSDIFCSTSRHRDSSDDVRQRKIDCYDKLREIYYKGICKNGCRYLAVEYYYADKAIGELSSRVSKLTTLRGISDNSTPYDEKTDTVLAELNDEIEAIVRTYFEGELLELVTMALAEQLNLSAKQAKYLPKTTFHFITPEEISRLKESVDHILALAPNQQPMSH